MPDYTLRGNGLYLPRGYELAPPTPLPPRQREFFAYATIGAAIPYVAATPVQPFWWLDDDVYELHSVVAYLDQYENLLMDHVEELVLQTPHYDAMYELNAERDWKRESKRLRMCYYRKLGLL